MLTVRRRRDEERRELFMVADRDAAFEATLSKRQQTHALAFLPPSTGLLLSSPLPSFLLFFFLLLLSFLPPQLGLLLSLPADFIQPGFFAARHSPPSWTRFSDMESSTTVIGNEPMRSCVGFSEIAGIKRGWQRIRRLWHVLYIVRTSGLGVARFTTPFLMDLWYIVGFVSGS